MKRSSPSSAASSLKSQASRIGAAQSMMVPSGRWGMAASPRSSRSRLPQLQEGQRGVRNQEGARKEHSLAATHSLGICSLPTCPQDASPSHQANVAH